MQQVKSHSKFEPLIDVAEAAMLLRMHPRTLRAKARKRIIPAIQVGKRWRFRASTLIVGSENSPADPRRGARNHLDRFPESDLF